MSIFFWNRSTCFDTKKQTTRLHLPLCLFEPSVFVFLLLLRLNQLPFFYPRKLLNFPFSPHTTRGIIDAILDGSILKAPTKKIPYFDFEVPTELPGVDSKILDPRDTYADASEWEKKAQDLASRFIKNFAKYEGNEAGKKLVAAGPKL